LCFRGLRAVLLTVRLAGDILIVAFFTGFLYLYDLANRIPPGHGIAWGLDGLDGNSIKKGFFYR